MYLIDAHNDTAYRMFFEQKGLTKNDFHLDFQNKPEIGLLFLFAIFLDPKKLDGFESHFAYFQALYHHFMKHLQQADAPLMLANGAKDLLTAEKPLAMITVEGGSLIDSTERVDVLGDMNIRAITLTWNNSNQLATSQMSGDAGGLTSFGKTVIEKMNRSGILVDLSHASDRTFWDVLELTNRPVLVSHSNSRALWNHPRNITDDMFLALIENGGVLGINFYPPFLGETADISTIFSHIEHFLDLGGEHHIAFGSDFDGMGVLPKGISGISSFTEIINEMERRNYPRKLTEKICYQNMMRILS